MSPYTDSDERNDEEHWQNSCRFHFGATNGFQKKNLLFQILFDFIDFEHFHTLTCHLGWLGMSDMVQVIFLEKTFPEPAFTLKWDIEESLTHTMSHKGFLQYF